VSLVERLEQVLVAITSGEDLGEVIKELRLSNLDEFARALELYVESNVEALRELEDLSLSRDDVCAYLSRYLLIALGVERPSEEVVQLFDQAVGGRLDLNYAINLLAKYLEMGDPTNAFLVADIISFVDDVERLRVRRAVVEKGVRARAYGQG